MNYKISHPTKVVECKIDLPASKSISNRLLIIQALCKQEFAITNLSTSEDTKSLQKALKATKVTIDVGAAGTSFRFLTAYLSTLVGNKFILTGSNRMKERPIKELVDALLYLGIEIKYLEKSGFPPLAILGTEITENKVSIDGQISSQFISALLLIAPTLKNGLKLQVSGKIVSKPYIIMTLKLMEEFGISHTWLENTIEIKPQKYNAKDYSIEADWSAASFWYEIAALCSSCNIILNGLTENSIQGDRKVSELFNNLGVQTKFENGSIILTKKEEKDIMTNTQKHTKTKKDSTQPNQPTNPIPSLPQTHIFKIMHGVHNFHGRVHRPPRHRHHLMVLCRLGPAPHENAHAPAAAIRQRFIALLAAARTVTPSCRRDEHFVVNFLH